MNDKYYTKLCDDLEDRSRWLAERSRVADAILMQRAAKKIREHISVVQRKAALSAPPVDVNGRLLKALEPFAREARLIDGSLDKGLPDTARIAGTEALTVGDLRRAAIAADADGGGA
jgi:hypothetical protein